MLPEKCLKEEEGGGGGGERKIFFQRIESFLII